MVATLTQQTGVQDRVAAHRQSRLQQIHLSVVVTVFTETLSIHETMAALLANDRGYIHEILLVISPRASEESFAICRGYARQDPRVRVLVRQNNSGIGCACH